MEKKAIWVSKELHLKLKQACIDHAEDNEPKTMEELLLLLITNKLK